MSMASVADPCFDGTCNVTCGQALREWLEAAPADKSGNLEALIAIGVWPLPVCVCVFVYARARSV